MVNWPILTPKITHVRLLVLTWERLQTPPPTTTTTTTTTTLDATVRSLGRYRHITNNFQLAAVADGLRFYAPPCVFVLACSWIQRRETHGTAAWNAVVGVLSCILRCTLCKCNQFVARQFADPLNDLNARYVMWQWYYTCWTGPLSCTGHFVYTVIAFFFPSLVAAGNVLTFCLLFVRLL